jgi:hypothetical protein
MELGWFLQLYREVQKVQQAPTADLLSGSVDVSVGVSNRLSSVSSSQQLLETPVFLACFAPRIGSARPKAKRTEYMRVLTVWWQKFCSSRDSTLFDIHAKAYLMATDGLLAYENIVLDPASFILSIISYNWPRSPSPPYANALHQFLSFNKTLVVPLSTGSDITLAGMQRACMMVIGELVDAALAMLDFQHMGHFQGYDMLTVEFLSRMRSEYGNPFEKMARIM